MPSRRCAGSKSRALRPTPRAIAPKTCAMPSQTAETNFRSPINIVRNTDGFEDLRGFTGARPFAELRPCGRLADVRGRVVCDGEAI